MQDLDAGLGISRLSRSTFVHFMQLANFCTTYVRLKQVQPSCSLLLTSCCSMQDLPEGQSVHLAFRYVDFWKTMFMSR